MIIKLSRTLSLVVEHLPQEKKVEYGYIRINDGGENTIVSKEVDYSGTFKENALALLNLLKDEFLDLLKGIWNGALEWFDTLRDLVLFHSERLVGKDKVVSTEKAITHTEAPVFSAAVKEAAAVVLNK